MTPGKGEKRKRRKEKRERTRSHVVVGTWAYFLVSFEASPGRRRQGRMPPFATLCSTAESIQPPLRVVTTATTMALKRPLWRRIKERTLVRFLLLLLLYFLSLAADVEEEWKGGGLN